MARSIVCRSTRSGPRWEPLAAKYAITIAPSAAVLRALWRRPHPAGGDRGRHDCSALGDPRSPQYSQGVTSDGRSGRDVSDSVVASSASAASAEEARLVARYAPSRRTSGCGSAASAAYLLHAPLDGYRVIHIATHASSMSGVCARTALVLAAGSGESGWVTPIKLASLHLDADLVVFSGCRTAGGVVSMAMGCRDSP